MSHSETLNNAYFDDVLHFIESSRLNIRSNAVQSYDEIKRREYMIPAMVPRPWEVRRPPPCSAPAPLRDDDMPAWAMTMQREMQRMSHEIGDLQNKVLEQSRIIRRLENPTPVDPRSELPPFDKITRIYAQYFDNVAKNKAIRATTGKSGTLPNHQVKIYVWTCAKREIDSYVEGTCGNFFFPVYKPNTRESRLRLQDKLDHLNDTASQWIGCLRISGVGPKYNQYVAVCDDWRLYLMIDGKMVEFGSRTEKPDAADDGAALWRWDWRLD